MYLKTEIRKIDLFFLYPSRGAFAKVTSEQNGYWRHNGFDSCREVFYETGLVKKMLFTHGPGRGLAVAAFIDKVETRLNIEERSIFGPTNRPMITWIDVSPFWNEQGMRRSLFTALLRSGMAYSVKRDNYTTALWSCTYLNNTRYAVTRFLSGHTRYTGRIKGWFDQFFYDGRKFQRPSIERINKLLVKP